MLKNLDSIQLKRKKILFIKGRWSSKLNPPRAMIRFDVNATQRNPKKCVLRVTLRATVSIGLTKSPHLGTSYRTHASYITPSRNYCLSLFKGMKLTSVGQGHCPPPYRQSKLTLPWVSFTETMLRPCDS